jgi:CBS domain-containing protein
MTTQVVTAARQTPFKELAALLSSRHISAVPVLDNRGRVIGVASQADLLPKEAFRGHQPSRREQLVQLEEMEKAGGTVAGDVMSSPPVVVGPDATLSEAARLMARHRVRRLPVTDARGRVVGVVSRGDLLKVFLVPDEELAATVVAELARGLPGGDTGRLTVSVVDGVVTIGGVLHDTSRVPTVAQITRSVEGVVDIRFQLDS